MAKKLTKEQKKEIALLRANNEMYEKTIKQAQERGASQDVINRIQVAKNDVIQQLNKLGVEDVSQPIEEDKSQTKQEKDKEMTDILMSQFEEDKEAMKTEVVENKEESVIYTSYSEDETVEYQDGMFPDDIPDGVQYDVIPLPSGGQCYKNKLSRIPVAYLTAYDENMIMSPNLYHDGLIIDYLVKNKVLTKAIDPSDLVSGDVDAITLFLRANSYGTAFPVEVRDPKTGEMISYNVDLSKLKIKEFKLKGDENGHFDFHLPHSGIDVKFRYLTKNDERILERISKVETDKTRSMQISYIITSLEGCLKADKSISQADRDSLNATLGTLRRWKEDLESKGSMEFSMVITNRMEMEIVSINGNSDRKFIHEAVKAMPAQDSLALRRYILDNEPGVDFEVEVERPESLGGGSFKRFLNWGDSIFWNIA